MITTTYLNNWKTHTNAPHATKNLRMKQIATNIDPINQNAKKLEQRQTNNAHLPKKTMWGNIQQKTQLQIHEEQHKNKCTLYTIDKEGPIDRRKMIYQGTPIQEQTQVQGLIKYNKQK